MTRKSILYVTSILLSALLMINGAAMAQQKPQPPLPSGLLPLAPGRPASLPEIGGRKSQVDGDRKAQGLSLRSLGSQTATRGPMLLIDGTSRLKHEKIDPDATNSLTIPHWSDSFTYQGLVYKYTMVGTDPKRGSATTVIPTVLIPIRFVFADGNVFDATTDVINGQTPIQGIINSPIFQNYDFNNNQGNYYFGGMANPVKVGNTQYGDAFQRANFWDSVSTRAPNYHVLLGQPTVLPIQTINVPNGLFSYVVDPNTGELLPSVDRAFLESQTEPILTAANVSATMLPIMVWGKVVGDPSYAFHGVISINGNTLQTFIGTSYLAGNFGQDVYALSHEILEWLDDPFGSNFTSGWDFPGLFPPDVRCDSFLMTGGRDLLEVADPVEVFFDSAIELPGAAYTYHVTEAMFIDFYTRSSRSRSYNGQYSFFEIGAPYGLLTGPSSPCTGHLEFKPTFIAFPGASFTAVTGINNRGDATGFYDDAGGQHGFVLTGARFSTLDFPGSVVTDPYKINDLGMIVGTFQDSSGLVHGFSYSKGTWTQIDFPGSADTEAYGVNSAGDIVGNYDAFQPVTHGFRLTGGKFQTIETPYGIQSAAQGINDFGEITGFGWSDPFAGPYTGFKLRKNSFTQFDFPGSQFTLPYSINNASDLAGFFIDPEGSFWGMVTVYGYPYQVYAAVFGNNDLGQICGYAYDYSDRRYKGFIGDLPLQQNAQ